MEKITIKAVHDKDLEKFLAKLGLLEKIEKKELRCSICGEVITLENFLCVYPENGKIKVCCNKKECYEKVLAKVPL
ncbi:hypothetical protein DRP04_13970 [Archaeoglobales archaeon]|nr:MAG: hypothetical protein DRP04_13970 [Archaeoglobales archaeon]